MNALSRNPDGRPPNFLIIGAQKSGTTSVVRALNSVEGCWVTPKKELHYFNRFDPINDPRSWKRYLREFSDAPEGALVGEATPEYLPSTEAPQRIYSTVPNVRLVIVLRNPVDRAYSAYWHALRWGVVPRSTTFANFIERETREFGADWTDVVSRGCYSTQIMRYLSYFHREQMFIALFEDLVLNSAKVMTALLAHIGQNHTARWGANFPHENRAHTWRFPKLSRRILVLRGKPVRQLPVVRRVVTRRYEVIPSMDSRDRISLTEIFRPWNRQLESILDRSLSEWGT